MKNVGFNTHRLQAGDVCCITEMAFVELFNNEEERTPNKLMQIVNPPDKKLSARDIKVAMSMMQWFGTNVGRAFFFQADKIAQDRLAALDEAQDLLRNLKLRFPEISDYIK